MKYLLLIAASLSTAVTYAQSTSTTIERPTSTSSAPESTSEAVIESEDRTPSKKNIEKIEVTGSLIKKVDVEGPSPVQSFDREYIENTGYNSAGDILREITANSFGSTREKSGSNAAGVAHVDLRGLGASRTLVLVNGKRIAKDGVTSAVDLNLIPAAAIDRIDVLKDGASATYGSDALAGVVNIITRKDFNGSEVSMRRDFSEGKGGHKTTMAVTYGASNDRGNIVTTFQYRKNERTFSRNREYSRSGSNEFAPTANYQTASSGKIANDRCPGGNAINDDGECLFTYANFSTELPEIEQINNFTSFSYDLTSNWNVNGNVKATRKETEWSYAPGANSLLYSDNAFYQTEFGATAVPDAYKNLPGYDSTNPNDYIWAKWRSLALGTRDTEVREDSFGGSLSLKRYIGDTWETEATVNADRIERRSDSVNGYAKRADLDALLNSGEFNILTNEGELPDSIRYQPWEMAKTEVTSGDIRATGEVIEGWAGPIAMAVGGSYSYEKYSNSRDELSLAGGVAGGGAGSIGYGTRHTQAAYMELAVPLHESVELSLAGRYDKFSDFGDTTNPKIAVKWKPSSIFMVRASAGTGFKAPEMINLHRGASSGQRNVVDVRNCPEEDWTDCNTVSITNKTQGNKDLKPEKSTSMNIGFVAQPTKEFSFTADYFKATITDQVGTALQNLLIVEAQGGDLSQYNSQILRGDDGTLLGVNSGPINMGKTVTSGIDLGAEYSTFVRGMGQFTIKNSYSYLLYHKQSSVFSTQLTDFVGTTSISSGLAYPKWRNQALIGFSRKKLSTNLSFNTISKYQKAVKNQGEMRSFTRIDGSVSYEILTDGILTIGAHNLIGRDAPRDDTITSSAADQLHGELYSTNGRSFFAQYKQTF